MRIPKFLLVMFPFLSVFAVSALATNAEDKLGFSGLAAELVGDGTDGNKGWLGDAALTKVLGLIFFAVGVWRAFAGSILQFFLMLGFAVLISQEIGRAHV